MKNAVLNEVSFAYDVDYILEDISLDIQEGEGCILLAGENGAGKSTLLNVLCGILKVQEGSVCRHKMKIAYLPFEIPLYEHLSVLENLRYFYRCFQGKDLSLTDSFVTRVLNTLSIDYLSQRLDRCSSGQRKKAGIACMLLSGADMIIMDEPFVAIDAESTQGLLALLQEMKQDTVVMLTSHTIKQLQETADRLLVLRGHHLVLDTRSRSTMQTYFQEVRK